MILVTVGTQLPFDRFVEAVDLLVPSIGKPAFAQIGDGKYVPQHMEYSAAVSPAAFNAKVAAADMIVSHAGIGTILLAQKFLKPIVLFPRRAALGEHRNDHQLATVDALEGYAGIYIARTVEELAAVLAGPMSAPNVRANSPSRLRLQSALTDFIRAV